MERCEGIDTVRVCSDDGMVQSFSQCPKFESCHAGACRPDDCSPGENLPICNFDVMAVCVDGKRTSASCENGMSCKGNECKAKESCTPEEARCSGDRVSGICSFNASQWNTTVCKSTEHCLDGFCQQRLIDQPVIEDVIEDVIQDVPSPLAG
jgi:hypothetical protein